MESDEITKSHQKGSMPFEDVSFVNLWKGLFTKSQQWEIKFIIWVLSTWCADNSSASDKIQSSFVCIIFASNYAWTFDQLPRKKTLLQLVAAAFISLPTAVPECAKARQKTLDCVNWLTKHTKFFQANSGIHKLRKPGEISLCKNFP